ncbi:MAG: FG-GAP-like repeat-containing protein [Planctomycetota bacterium]
MKRQARKRSVAVPASKLAASPLRKLLLGSAILAVAVASGAWFVVESSSRRLMVRAEDAANRQDFVEAERLAEIVLHREPDSVQALFLAGAAAWETHGAEAGVAYFERIPDDGSPEAAQAMFARAEFSFQRGWAADSERLFGRVIDLDPANVAARRRLLFIYAAQGRMWEVAEQALPLLKSGHAELNYLTATASSTKLLVADLPFVKQCLAAKPEDPLPRLIEAKWAMRDKQMLHAREVLASIVQKHPHVLDAQAAFGMTILETGTPEEFVSWQAQLPDDADEHPDIWFVRGLWSTQNEQPDAAVRCFGEALRRDANHAAANYQMSTALATLGKTGPAGAFAARARLLARMALLIDGEMDSDRMLEAVKLLRELGRLWEAAGWCRLALRTEADWAKPTLDRLLFEVADENALTINSANLAWQLDLAQYALPSFPSSPTPPSLGSAIAVAESQVRFRDVAVETDLAFTYFNGTVGNNLESLFELDGGGVGALDYDLDGWPDLYLTQGGPLPSRQESPPHDYRDRLFRGYDGERFVDTTVVSCLDNKLYSQGLAVGDFDADGFPDLYVANIGTNTLYRNNGDGTFQDVSAGSGTQGHVWTSSCLLADLNGDALPDIYAVNYIGGDKLYQACRIDIEPRCAPIAYAAEQDRLYLNRGDGTFADVTGQCGVIAPEGRGLGIVAADFDGSRRLSLFVANDMSANFFFQNLTPSPGDELKFVERAIQSGLAYDREGVSQATMGIAAGDANQDGLIDLFVTNYYREANAFYWQLPDGTFRDEIARSHLQQATFPVLGWGTQFVDAELDGIPDLLVTNGHVHDPWVKDVPYRMPPQFFHGCGSGRFEEVPAHRLGPYFEAKHLGRAMARLDWNRDGLEDVCIGHLDTAVALLRNETTTHGHWLSLSLVGVDTNRDAIGTVVRMTCGDRTSVRQLTAGDGFQCSNERRLVFGLGNATVVGKLELLWPSGLVQTFNDIHSDQELIVVEGHAAAFVRH